MAAIACFVRSEEDGNQAALVDIRGYGKRRFGFSGGGTGDQRLQGQEPWKAKSPKHDDVLGHEIAVEVGTEDVEVDQAPKIAREVVIGKMEILQRG